MMATLGDGVDVCALDVLVGGAAGNAFTTSALGGANAAAGAGMTGGWTLLTVGARPRRDTDDAPRPSRPRPRAGVPARMRADGWITPFAERVMTMVMMLMHETVQTVFSSNPVDCANLLRILFATSPK